MAPLLRNLKRRRDESEKTTTRVRATNKASASTAGAKNMGIEKLTAARNKGSGKTTTKPKAGVGATEKHTSTAQRGKRRVTPSMSRCPHEFECGEREDWLEPARVRMSQAPRQPQDLMDASGDYEKIRPDKEAWIKYAQADREYGRQYREEPFQKLKDVLEKNGLYAGDEPFKYGMGKLLGGEAMTKEVREEIGKCIHEKLGEVKRYFGILMVIWDWDDEMAGYVTKCINEVTEYVGVDFTDLKEICSAAEDILKEPVTVYKIAKGEYVKNLIRSWIHNTRNFQRIHTEWVANPKASFSCVDPDNFDDTFVKRYHPL